MKKFFIPIFVLICIFLSSSWACAENPYLSSLNVIENLHSPFECKISITSLTSPPNNDESVYGHGASCMLYYRSERSGYVYIFVVRNNDTVELFYPSSQTDDNYIHANTSYQGPGRGHFSLLSPLGDEAMVMFVLPEKLDPDKTEWLKRSFEQKRFMVEALHIALCEDSPTSTDRFNYVYTPKLNSGTPSEFLIQITDQFHSLFGEKWSSVYTKYLVREDKPKRTYIYDYSDFDEAEKLHKTDYILKSHPKIVLKDKKSDVIPNEGTISPEEAVSIARTSVKSLTEEYGYQLDELEVSVGYFETDTIYHDWWDVCFSYYNENEIHMADFIVNVNATTGDIVRMSILDKTLPDRYEEINGYKLQQKVLYDFVCPTLIVYIEFYDEYPFSFKI